MRIVDGIIVVATLIFAVAAISVYNEGRSHASRDACMKNLKQMDQAKAKWAIEETLSSDGTTNLVSNTNIRSRDDVPQ